MAEKCLDCSDVGTFLQRARCECLSELMQVPSTGERGPINDAFKHAQQVPVRIPSERGEDQIIVLFGQFLQDGNEFWMQRNLPLLPVFGDESLFGLCSNGEDAFDQIKIGPMEVGNLQVLAEREGFEPSVEFPLHTLSKRAPSTARPSLPAHSSAEADANLHVAAPSYSFRL